MLVDEIWDFKSINMGRELEISGEFIYESAKKTMSITGLNNQYEINIIWQQFGNNHSVGQNK